MVTAALRWVFPKQSAEAIESRWNDLAASFVEHFPNNAAVTRLAGRLS
jgi:hypothetical protein